VQYIFVRGPDDTSVDIRSPRCYSPVASRSRRPPRFGSRRKHLASITYPKEFGELLRAIDAYVDVIN